MIRYPKIRAPGTSEVKGILNEGVIEITEKLDGANIRIMRVGEDLVIGSRNNSHVVGVDENGNPKNFLNGWGLWAYHSRKELMNAIRQAEALSYEGVCIVGEWMVKHSIRYGIAQPYPVFYDAFIPNQMGEVDFVSKQQRDLILNAFEHRGFAVLWPLHTFDQSDPDQEPIGLDDLMDISSKLKSCLNPDVDAEGIVVKNASYRNVYGRHCHLKIVNEHFKEKNEKTFGAATKVKGDSKARVERQLEGLVESYVTPARIRKLLHANPLAAWAMQDMAWLPKTLAADILLEEILVFQDNLAYLNFRDYHKFVSRFAVEGLKRVFAEDP